MLKLVKRKSMLLINYDRNDAVESIISYERTPSGGVGRYSLTRENSNEDDILFLYRAIIELGGLIYRIKYPE